MLIQAKQQKVHYLFCFGKHETAEDFAKAKRIADVFRPHLYAPEGSNVARKNLEEYREINHRIEKARKNPDERREWLASVDEMTKGHPFREYFMAQASYVIDSRDKIYQYSLDVHSSPFDNEAEKMHRTRNESLQLASLGDMPGAKSRMIEAARSNAESTSRRETDIVEGMKTFVPDVLVILSQLEKYNPLKVFSTWGTLHANIYARASEMFRDDPNVILEMRELETTPLLPFSRITFSFMVGKQVSDELVLQAIVARILFKKYELEGGRAGNSSKEHVLQLSCKLGYDQIQELLVRNALKQQQTDLDDWYVRVGSEFEALAGMINN
ncbi:MAG: hypothetical protein V1909_06620 [Candidatus Micrarchaeota archaeon]